MRLRVLDRRHGLRKRAHTQLMRIYGPVAQRHVRSDRRWRTNGLRLAVPTGVFHPGLFFSSSVLARELVRVVVPGDRVLDAGCGTGVLALAAARAGAVVTAVDLNPAAVDTCLRNAAANALVVEAIESDLFAAVEGRTFDLVVVNPPYFDRDPADVVERAWYAGAGLAYFDRFFAGLTGIAPRALMVLAEGCDMARITAAASAHGWQLNEIRRRIVWLGGQVVFEVRSSDVGSK